MSFRLVPKSVILNDIEQRNGCYFASFQRIRVASGPRGALRKSSPHLGTDQHQISCTDKIQQCRLCIQ